MPTIHQFIDGSQAQPTHRRAILGTIHPPQILNFRIPYFYGNRGNLWDLLSESFPHLNFGCLTSIIQTLSDNDIWINDMIRQCDHINGNAADNQLDNIILNTEQIRDGLAISKIDTIFFTSELTFTLFKRAFGMRLRFNRETREMQVPERYFGRVINAVVLYSPSDNACRGIAGSKSYKDWQEINQLIASVNAFRINHYQNKMAFLNR